MWFSTPPPLPWARALSLALEIAVFSANLLFLCFPLCLIRKRKKKKRKSNDDHSPGEQFVFPGAAADHLCVCTEQQENVPISVPLCFQFHRTLLLPHLCRTLLKMIIVLQVSLHFSPLPWPFWTLLTPAYCHDLQTAGDSKLRFAERAWLLKWVCFSKWEPNIECWCFPWN